MCKQLGMCECSQRGQPMVIRAARGRRAAFVPLNSSARSKREQEPQINCVYICLTGTEIFNLNKHFLGDRRYVRVEMFVCTCSIQFWTVGGARGVLRWEMTGRLLCERERHLPFFIISWYYSYPFSYFETLLQSSTAVPHRREQIWEYDVISVGRPSRENPGFRNYFYSWKQTIYFPLFDSKLHFNLKIKKYTKLKSSHDQP